MLILRDNEQSFCSDFVPLEDIYQLFQISAPIPCGALLPRASITKTTKLQENVIHINISQYKE